MLRTLVLGLGAANIAFFAWSQGWLGDIAGISPLGEREPQRLELQVNPQNLRVLPVSGAGSGAAAANALNLAAVCLEAGPFSSAELVSAEAAARSTLPDGSWSVLRQERPGVWLVYMGRFANRDQQQKKMAELKRLNIAFDTVDAATPSAANLEPGLSFGRFNRLEDAQDLLRRLENQRVRSARVVTLTAPSATVTLRIPRADAELQTVAVGLRDAFKGKAFGACARA